MDAFRGHDDAGYAEGVTGHTEVENLNEERKYRKKEIIFSSTHTLGGKNILSQTTVSVCPSLSYMTVSSLGAYRSLEHFFVYKATPAFARSLTHFFLSHKVPSMTVIPSARHCYCTRFHGCILVLRTIFLPPPHFQIIFSPR